MNGSLRQRKCTVILFSGLGIVCYKSFVKARITPHNHIVLQTNAATILYDKFFMSILQIGQRLRWHYPFTAESRTIRDSPLITCRLLYTNGMVAISNVWRFTTGTFPGVGTNPCLRIYSVCPCQQPELMTKVPR